MSTLYTISYPELQADDLQWIENIRENHDPQFKIIRPHFTLVFGCRHIPPIEYIQNVKAIAASLQEVTFTCKCVSVNVESDSSYLFLVPDDGALQIMEIHRKLHVGAFSSLLSSKHQFFPHITLANSLDAEQLQPLADQINAQPLSIRGKLSTIEVCSFQPGQLTSLASFSVQA